jgi:vacuolar protein sorting-associated protein 13A/C
VHLISPITFEFPGVSKMQYRDLVKFLESMDRMARAAPYRKYRPFISKYRGYYKNW